MRSSEEVKQIQDLSQNGKNPSEISRELQIPRSTITGILKKKSQTGIDLSQKRYKQIESNIENHPRDYSYLLGMYLGDGYINKMPRTYYMRISLDSRYPKLVEEIINRSQKIFSFNKVASSNRGNCAIVSWSSNHLPKVFPQHGPGMKLSRKIELESWQKVMVGQHSEDFIRGLLHSDGCRENPLINNKRYPRYLFTNYSQDILTIFGEACDNLDIHYRRQKRRIYIAKRKDVAYLDKFVGKKK